MSDVTWQSSTVLITGGTGSFGRRFVEMMLRECRPHKLIVFSRDEQKQHEMRASGLDHLSLRYFIGDVRDLERLRRAMTGVDVVVHAAALKQVPSCEYNPFEAIKTNILGAQNVVEAAIDCGVSRVMAVSTDKAVNPINLYGATKLCAEKMFVQGNAYSGTGGTAFACCRYGNVIGSRGSVIPLLLGKRPGEKVPVTDPRMTRFWLTLDEGVTFVRRSIERMRGGEVFVPKLPSMNIMDLVKAIVPDAPVELVGIRPGEKLHEALLSPDEARHSIEHDDYFVIQPAFLEPLGEPDDARSGQPCPDHFAYTSDTNDQWLTIDELRLILERSGIASVA